MNYIKHLSAFFDKVKKDDTINHTEITLYIALCQFLFQRDPMKAEFISRQKLMLDSKIASKATYHKAINYLNDNGYIRYIPSYNPTIGSSVALVLFTNTKIQKATLSKNGSLTASNDTKIQNHTKICNSSIPIDEPLYNNIYIPNNIYIKSSTKNEQVQNLNRLHERKKLRKENGMPPAINEVKDFFKANQSSPLQSQRFYDYYSSNGWLVGGKAEMKDWKASARNWIVNNVTNQNNGINKQTDRAKQLQVSSNKNYSEPL